MKARMPKAYTTRKQISEEVQKQYSAHYEEHQRAIQKDVAVQLTAIFLYTMHVCYGYGQKRLKRLLADFNSTCDDMNGVAFVKAFDCNDLIRWCKKYADIDLHKEIETDIKSD